MVSKYNSEGYKDPVVYEALARVEAEERAARAVADYRPLVYICSPYAGDIERNTYRARAFSRFAVEKKYIPIAPHLLCPQYLNEETERWLGLKMGIVFMGKCEEVWVFGDAISEGMAAEIEKAKRMRKKIRYFTDDLREKEVTGE
ncbi:MAG: DUF4406 domain-containing protein [Lachnospiraceae bacterium]|nr:hypothetical protein [Muribaculaceae bacterium]MCM1411090.1 DUF4406 domain-containing protein [Lachnospiraceae bacterium]